jgi:1-deoxy-D-xylulose-5-phosphate synthase
MRTVHPIEIGKSEWLQYGTDVAIIGLGGVLDRCIVAAELLRQEGISSALINARFVKPMDEDMLRQVTEQFCAVVTVEEHVRQCGFGSAVLETLNQWRVPGERVMTIALPDEFISHGSPEVARKRHRCTAAAIAERTRTHWLECGGPSG